MSKKVKNIALAVSSSVAVAALPLASASCSWGKPNPGIVIEITDTYALKTENQTAYETAKKELQDFLKENFNKDNEADQVIRDQVAKLIDKKDAHLGLENVTANEFLVAAREMAAKKVALETELFNRNKEQERIQKEFEASVVDFAFDIKDEFTKSELLPREVDLAKVEAKTMMEGISVSNPSIKAYNDSDGTVVVEFTLSKDGVKDVVKTSVISGLKVENFADELAKINMVFVEGFDKDVTMPSEVVVEKLSFENVPTSWTTSNVTIVPAKVNNQEGTLQVSATFTRPNADSKLVVNETKTFDVSGLKKDPFYENSKLVVAKLLNAINASEVYASQVTADHLTFENVDANWEVTFKTTADDVAGTLKVELTVIKGDIQVVLDPQEITGFKTQSLEEALNSATVDVISSVTKANIYASQLNADQLAVSGVAPSYTTSVSIVENSANDLTGKLSVLVSVVKGEDKLEKTVELEGFKINEFEVTFNNLVATYKEDQKANIYASEATLANVIIKGVDDSYRVAFLLSNKNDDLGTLTIVVTLHKDGESKTKEFNIEGFKHEDFSAILNSLEVKPAEGVDLSTINPSKLTSENIQVSAPEGYAATIKSIIVESVKDSEGTVDVVVTLTRNSDKKSEDITKSLSGLKLESAESTVNADNLELLKEYIADGVQFFYNVKESTIVAPANRRLLDWNEPTSMVTFATVTKPSTFADASFTIANALDPINQASDSKLVNPRLEVVVKENKDVVVPYRVVKLNAEGKYELANDVVYTLVIANIA